MHTPLCDELGIEFPIFAFTHCRDVVVAVSKAGGFGVLGAVGFTPEQLEKVKHALGWTKMKQARIVQIRPTAELDGHAFSAFSSKSLRREYLEMGRACARAVFEAPAQRWLTADDQPDAAQLRLVP